MKTLTYKTWIKFHNKKTKHLLKKLSQAKIQLNSKMIKKLRNSMLQLKGLAKQLFVQLPSTSRFKK